MGKKKVYLVSKHPFDCLGAKSAGIGAIYVHKDLGLMDLWEHKVDFEVNDYIDICSLDL